MLLDVLCAGTPEPGTRLHVDVAVRAGGSAVNAAAAALAAGAAATVVGRIGADPSGALVAAELEARGIEARLARDPARATGVAVALGVEPATVAAHPGASSALRPDDLPGAIDGAALFVSGFALFQPAAAAAARAALDRFTGAWAGVDLASPGLAARAAESALDDAAARGANVVLATAEEARAVTGAGAEESARLLARRFAVACVKLGAAGAIAAAGDRVERRAAQRVARTSPFGAGDAFGATMLVALAQGDPLGRALGRACDAGARAAGG